MQVTVRVVWSMLLIINFQYVLTTGRLKSFLMVLLNTLILKILIYKEQ